MRKLFTTLILAFAALLLVGCESTPYTSQGNITHKEHIPAYEEMYFICGAYGSNGTCTVQVPIYNSYPECYSITWESAGGLGTDCLSREQWEGIQMGQWYEAE